MKSFAATLFFVWSATSCLGQEEGAGGKVVSPTEGTGRTKAVNTSFYEGYVRDRALVPTELSEAAKALEESFRASEPEELLRQKWTGELCWYHPCMSGISEDQAKDLLDAIVESEQRSADQYVTRLNLFLAALSLCCSFIAVWQTIKANRVAREASDRSRRSEDMIELISERA